MVVMIQRLLASVLIGSGVATAAGSGGETDRVPQRGLPQAGAIVSTLRLPLRGTVLFAARDRSLFALVVAPGSTGSVTVLRVDPRGAVSRTRVAFAHSGFLMNVSAGRDGVYAGTAVIKRFADVPDELVRIDAVTLRIRARAFFPAAVASAEDGRRMWASIGDGRVVRLDPRTLETEASRRIVPAG